MKGDDYVSEPIVVMRSIEKIYHMGEEDHRVLKDVSFSVDKGEFVAILGPSGSGKSTMMNILGCLDTPTSGEYILHGRPIQELDEGELARIRSREVGFIFQSFQLLPRMNALRNVILPLIYANVPAKDREAIAMRMLKRVGLEDKLYHLPNQLSGGQGRLVGKGHDGSQIVTGAIIEHHATSSGMRSKRRLPRRRLQVRALFSCMLVFASPTTAVSTFAMSPVAYPSQPKCHGMPI